MNKQIPIKRVFLIVALVSAIWVVVGFFFGFINGMRVTTVRSDPAPSTFPPYELVEVVFAVEQVEQFNTITPDDVTLVAFPKDLLITSMITDLDQVIGRTAKVDIEHGMFITEGFLMELIPAGPSDN